MRTFRSLSFLFLALAPAGALAQDDAIIADRPGFMFSAATVGRGVVQVELGLPSITLYEFDNGVDDDSEVRFTSVVGLVRFGLTDDFELRLGAPVYTEVQSEFGRFSDSDSGYGDLEVGAKWHLLDNEGGRPAFALIPSVIVPTGEDGFTADDPVYQLNAAFEWTFAEAWGLSALAGYLNGPDDGDRYGQETFGVSLGRPFPREAWSFYGEAVLITTDLDEADDVTFVGAGIKFLPTNDVQLDFSFDRGLTDESPEWLLGLGVSARF
jgi:hypothetical protein